MLQEPFLEDVELKFFPSDKVVGVAIDFARVDGTSGVCVKWRENSYINMLKALSNVAVLIVLCCSGGSLCTRISCTLYMYVYL